MVVLPACLPSGNGAEAAAWGQGSGGKVRQSRWDSAPMGRESRVGWVMVTRGSQEFSWTQDSVVTRRCRVGNLNYWFRFRFVIGKGELRAIYSIAWANTKGKALSLIHWKVQRAPARLLPALLPAVRSHNCTISEQP